MSKFKKEEPKEKIRMSEEMIKKCKSDIAKYGFNFPEYEKFLESVGAMKDGKVLKFPDIEIQQYRNLFLKKNEEMLNPDDAEILNKFRIIKGEPEGPGSYTGYFCPRSFWDYVSSVKL